MQSGKLFFPPWRGRLRLGAGSNPGLSSAVLPGPTCLPGSPGIWVSNPRALLERWGGRELGPGERWEGGPRVVTAFPPAPGSPSQIQEPEGREGSGQKHLIKAGQGQVGAHGKLSSVPVVTDACLEPVLATESQELKVLHGGSTDMWGSRARAGAGRSGMSTTQAVHSGYWVSEQRGKR